MKDLRPYVCTFQDCFRADYTYASRKAFLSHEHDVHGFEGTYWRTRQRGLPKNCAFCEEVLSNYDRIDRSRHLARHMEEIAFTVVPKPYEDWDFYSDTSSVNYQGMHNYSTSHDDLPVLSSFVNMWSAADVPDFSKYR